MKTDDFTRQVLLIEVGTSYTKCGLSGSANPLFVFPYNLDPYFNAEKPLNDEEWVSVVSDYFTTVFSKAMISTVNDKKVIIGHHIYAPVGFLDAVCSVLLKSYRVSGVLLYPSVCSVPLAFKKLTGLSVSCGYRTTQSISLIDGAPLQYTLKSISIGSHEVEKKFRAIEGLEKVQEEQCSQLIQECVYVRNDGDEPKEDYLFYDAAYHTKAVPSESRWQVVESFFDLSFDNSSLATLICSSLLASPRMNRVQLASNICLSGSIPCLSGFLKRLYKELFDVINTNSLYEELKPLLKTIHLYIEGESSFLTSYKSLVILSNLKTNLNYLTLEQYLEKGYQDPLVEGNL